MDEPALKAIGSLLRGRKVYPIYARDIIVGGEIYTVSHSRYHSNLIQDEKGE